MSTPEAAQTIAVGILFSSFVDEDAPDVDITYALDTLASATQTMFGDDPKLIKQLFSQVVHLAIPDDDTSDYQEIIDALVVLTLSSNRAIEAGIGGGCDGCVTRLKRRFTVEAIYTFLMIWLFILVTLVVGSFFQCRVLKPVTSVGTYLWREWTPPGVFAGLWETATCKRPVGADAIAVSFGTVMPLKFKGKGWLWLLNKLKAKFWQSAPTPTAPPASPRRRSPRRGKPTKCLLPNCNAPATMRCAECRMAIYCGEKCQELDWAVHVNVCQQK